MDLFQNGFFTFVIQFLKPQLFQDQLINFFFCILILACKKISNILVVLGQLGVLLFEHCATIENLDIYSIVVVVVQGIVGLQFLNCTSCVICDGENRFSFIQYLPQYCENNVVIVSRGLVTVETSQFVQLRFKKILLLIIIWQKYFCLTPKMFELCASISGWFHFEILDLQLSQIRKNIKNSKKLSQIWILAQISGSHKHCFIVPVLLYANKAASYCEFLGNQFIIILFCDNNILVTQHQKQKIETWVAGFYQ
eukprot:TRINITY_DN5552_c0_g1_i1.p3 TRINITY_DN5552_c0_g1~~TRINITY_DN5552_c0_g1_i1.p3  ORF type:complete len:253 (-),score=0.47 TRINITY_DN5552_c0_g1_i1:935-1693(-)